MKLTHNQSHIGVLRALKALKTFAAFSVVALLAACSSDSMEDPAPQPEPQPEAKSNFYIRLNASLSSDAGSRSGTETSGESQDGRLDAEDLESTIESVNVIFCEVKNDNDPGQDEYLTSIFGYPEQTGTVSNKTLTLEIQDKDKFLADVEKKTMRLYIVANYQIPSTGIVGATDKFSYSGFDGHLGIYSKGGRLLPLVNYEPSGIIDFSTLSKDEIRALFYAAADNKLNISGTIKNPAGTVYGSANTIKLERTVARIDYMGVPEPEVIAEVEDAFSLEDSHVVPLVDDASKKDSQSNLYQLRSTKEVYMRLTHIQLFNVSKEAYLFRHTKTGTKSAAGFAGTSTLLGFERGDNDNAYNWVVDTDWSTTDVKGTNFLFPFTYEYGNSPTGYTANASQLEVTKVLSEDQFTGNVYEKESTTYHPCWYVSENTIPSKALMADVDADDNLVAPLYATGVKFRVVICGKDGQPLPETLSSDYKYKPDEVTYGTTTDGKNIITVTLADDTWQEIAWDETYKGYYVTYFGLINHNVPNNWTSDDDLQPMHYGVVRNNVYQISVSSIKHLPDPQEPKTYFLTIECKVADWNDRWDDDVTLY